MPQAIPLINAIYRREGGGAGCCLHILTDDYNVDDDSASHCLDRARERGHADCIAAAEMLIHMTTTQRSKAARKAGYDVIAPVEPTYHLLALPDALWLYRDNVPLKQLPARTGSEITFTREKGVRSCSVDGVEVWREDSDAAHTP